jgi:hypothetical protein
MDHGEPVRRTTSAGSSVMANSLARTTAWLTVGIVSRANPIAGAHEHGRQGRVPLRCALPRARTLSLHLLGQRRRSVDLLIDAVEVVLDLSRCDGAQSQAESQRPDVEFHRGQAIQDAVSKASSATARGRLFHH